jgi:diadenosine tetraphosphate (Ap4A) HIT family hydrolase
MITDIERALNDGVAPWKEIEYRTKNFWIFADSAAPPAGYLCFVPTWQTAECLYETYKAAYRWGYQGIEDGKWQGFNIVQSVGEVAGQSISYPHIHMVPRRESDLDD